MEYVLVTGASGGMGKSTVSELRRCGYGVFALDKTPADYDDPNIISLEADLCCEEDILRARDSVLSVTNELFAIIHFAGIYMMDSLVEMENEKLRRIFDVNLVAAYLVNKSFLPLLSEGSRIIITTSELAPLDPLPFTGIYAVTKAALDKYAYSLAMELQLLGIKVSVLRAGAVKTDMLGASTDALDRFSEKTKLYSCNADRFRNIVNRVEARSVPAEKIAKKILRILQKKRPAFAYSINKNPLLLMLNLLPKRFQLWAIRMVLKK